MVCKRKRGVSNSFVLVTNKLQRRNNYPETGWIDPLLHLVRCPGRVSFWFFQRGQGAAEEEDSRL